MPDKAKTIYLDRDGVILIDRGYSCDIDRLEFIPRAVEALRNVPDDYLLIVVSNQSGIARGYFSAAEADKFNEVMCSELKKKGVIINEIYYCPHSPDDKCDCRKPKIGLFEMAKARFNIDFAQSWMIGDKSSDILAGKNIGVSTIQVLTGYAGNEPGAVEVSADHVVRDLYEAVEIIRK